VLQTLCEGPNDGGPLLAKFHEGPDPQTLAGSTPVQPIKYGDEVPRRYAKMFRTIPLSPKQQSEIHKINCAFSQYTDHAEVELRDWSGEVVLDAISGFVFRFRFRLVLVRVFEWTVN